MAARVPIERQKGPRRRILEAARRLFADRGAESVTMAEVAEAAGVARATVFNHFGSKHALVEGLTEDVLDAYLVVLKEAVHDEERSVPTVVRSLLAATAREIERNRAFYRGVFREIAKLSVGLDEGGPGQRARQRDLELMKKLMERGQQRGELTQEHAAADLASVFASVVLGTITQWLYEDDDGRLVDRMRRVAGVFLDGAGTRRGTA